MTSSSYEEFRVLRLKFSASHQHGHQVFFKPHNVRAEEASKPRDRSDMGALCRWSIEHCVAKYSVADVLRLPCIADVSY